MTLAEPRRPRLSVMYERLLEAYDEAKHKRGAKGSSNGGQFVSSGGDGSSMGEHSGARAGEVGSTSGSSGGGVGAGSGASAGGGGTKVTLPNGMVIYAPRPKKAAGGAGKKAPVQTGPVTKAVTLGLNDSGDQVAALQTLLGVFGYQVNDQPGTYGEHTRNIVNELQRRLGETPTGKASVSLQHRLADLAKLMTAQMTEAAEAHTGAMVALLPSREDAARLAELGDEAADQLHLTLLYLGDAADIEPAARQAIVERLRGLVEDAMAPDYDMPVAADGMAVSVFNPPGVTQADGKDRDTCIVLGVSGGDLAVIHGMVADAVHETGIKVPDQHEPWVPHVTLAYTDDLSRVEDLAAAAGPIAFDRLRIAFAGDNTDIPLTGKVVESVRTARSAVALVRLAREAFDPSQLRGKDVGMKGSVAGRWVKGLIHGLGGPAPADGPGPDSRYEHHTIRTPGAGAVTMRMPRRRPRADDRVVDDDTVGTRPRIGHVLAANGDDLRVRWDDTGHVETRKVSTVQVAGVPHGDPARTFVATPEPKPRMGIGSAAPRTPEQKAADSVAAGHMDPHTAADLLRIGRGQGPPVGRGMREPAVAKVARTKAGPDVGGAAAAIRGGGSEGEIVQALDADASLTPAQLRKVAGELGIEVPANLRRKQALQSHIASIAAGRFGAGDGKLATRMPTPAASRVFDADSVAERAVSVDTANPGEIEAVLADVTSLANLRKVATAVNLPVPRDRKFTAAELRRYIAEQIAKDRTRWSLQ